MGTSMNIRAKATAESIAVTTILWVDETRGDDTVLVITKTSLNLTKHLNAAVHSGVTNLREV